MNSKLILIPILFLTTSAFAGNWFVGVNGGANSTMDTSTGDLPMARESFLFNDQRIEDYQIFFDLVNVQGLTLQEALELRKDLNLLKLKYSTGWNIDISGGYKYKNIIFGLMWKNITAFYKSINGEGQLQGRPTMGWASGNSSGKTKINTFLIFSEYEILKLKFKKIVPVVGLGIGFTAKTTEILNFETKKATQDQINFAYQGKIGVNYNINNQLQINIESVFFGTSRIKATNNYFKQIQLNMGVRYMFD